MVASVTVCIVGSLLFLCTTVLVVGFACGYSSPFQAVQALPTLSTVPYAWTMLEYLLAHGLLCLLACAVYSLAISAAAASGAVGKVKSARRLLYSSGISARYRSMSWRFFPLR